MYIRKDHFGNGSTNSTPFVVNLLSLSLETTVLQPLHARWLIVFLTAAMQEEKGFIISWLMKIVFLKTRVSRKEASKIDEVRLTNFIRSKWKLSLYLWWWWLKSLNHRVRHESCIAGQHGAGELLTLPNKCTYEVVVMFSGKPKNVKPIVVVTVIDGSGSEFGQ